MAPKLLQNLFIEQKCLLNNYFPYTASTKVIMIYVYNIYSGS